MSFQATRTPYTLLVSTCCTYYRGLLTCSLTQHLAREHSTLYGFSRGAPKEPVDWFGCCVIWRTSLSTSTTTQNCVVVDVGRDVSDHAVAEAICCSTWSSPPRRRPHSGEHPLPWSLGSLLISEALNIFIVSGSRYFVRHYFSPRMWSCTPDPAGGQPRLCWSSERHRLWSS